MSNTDPVITSVTGKVGECGDEQVYTIESFGGTISAPSNAKDVMTSSEDGKLVMRYTVVVSGASTTYQINGSTSQEPLATHKMFKPEGTKAVTVDEWKKWKIWEADPHDIELAGWKPDAEGNSDGIKAYYAYRNRGIEDYLVGTVTMRVTTEETSSPSLATLGKIASPANAPTLPNSRTWLCVGIDGERTAFGNSRWKVTREYRASAPGGWDTDIYDAA